MGKSQIIKINENDLKRLIAKKINEYSGQNFTQSMLKEGVNGIDTTVHINESHIRKIIKEIVDKVKMQMVVNDFMDAVKNSGNLAELLENGDDFIVIKGKLYNEYCIAINITERPGWVETRSEDYWNPAEYDLDGNLSFEIEEIWAEDAEDDVRRINLYDYLSDEQKKEVNDAFDFNEEDFALDADEYKDKYGYDDFDKADAWWDDHKMELDENIVKNIVRNVVSEITRKQKH